MYENKSYIQELFQRVLDSIEELPKVKELESRHEVENVLGQKEAFNKILGMLNEDLANRK